MKADTPRVGAPTVVAVLGLGFIVGGVWRLWSPAGAVLVCGVVLFGVALIGAWRSRPRLN